MLIKEILQDKFFRPTFLLDLLEWFILFCLDDTLEIDSDKDFLEDSPFLEAVKQMKEKRCEGVVELCTQQIEKGFSMAALIAHVQKEWKSGARLDMRSIMGSFPRGQHVHLFSNLCPPPFPIDPTTERAHTLAPVSHFF